MKHYCLNGKFFEFNRESFCCEEPVRGIDKAKEILFQWDCKALVALLETAVEWGVITGSDRWMEMKLYLLIAIIINHVSILNILFDLLLITIHHFFFFFFFNFPVLFFSLLFLSRGAFILVFLTFEKKRICVVLRRQPSTINK